MKAWEGKRRRSLRYVALARNLSRGQRLERLRENSADFREKQVQKSNKKCQKSSIKTPTPA
jgi:hypothetical protein